jgi:hypothetical protein
VLLKFKGDPNFTATSTVPNPIRFSYLVQNFKKKDAAPVVHWLSSKTLIKAKKYCYFCSDLFDI